MVCALFFANETTVLVARVALPRVLPTQWSNLQKIVQKPLEKWRKSAPKPYYSNSNVTFSCVGYWPTQMRTLSIISLHLFDIFSPLCVKKKSVFELGMYIVNFFSTHENFYWCKDVYVFNFPSIYEILTFYDLFDLYVPM